MRAKQTAVHTIALSEEKTAAYRVLQWCLCVPKIAPDSPRLAYYASRLDVPGKIARALADGSYTDITKDCPPIDLRHLSAGLAALAECQRYATRTAPTIITTPPKPRLHARKSKVA